MIGRRAVCAAVAWCVAACVIACVVAGCGKDGKAGKPATAGKPRVALVMKSLANEFFKTMEDGARAHQKAHPAEYDLIANGIRDEQDVAGQTAIVEQMIAQQVSALVIAPADSKALVPVCKKAIDAGIVVVNIDNKFDEAVLAEKKVRIPFVGPDNRKGAELAGMCLAKKLQARDQVAILQGRPNAFNGIQRDKGFNDAMSSAKANIVSSQSGLWETEPAMKIVGGITTQYPDLKAVLCANDSMALGAVAALKSGGKGGKVLVVGYDNISAIQQLIKEGKVLCTVDQHGDKIAVYGIEYALEILKSHQPAKDKETPVDLVTAETLK
jgi:ribose transport system substrate-binding protein